MTQFNSENSLIDDTRLQVSDSEVTFTVQVNPDRKDIYVMPTPDYAGKLAKTKHAR